MFADFGVKIKIDGTRAVGDDPHQIIDAMSDAWDELQTKLESMDEDKSGELLEKFNSLIDN